MSSPGLTCVALLIGMVGATLGGCASRPMSIRSLPPETPAADNAAAIEQMAAFERAARATDHTAAAAAVGSTGTGEQAALTAPPLTPADAPSMRTYDPWERLNRFTYRFNARFDEAVFLPAADGYRRLPAPIRTGVHNFFGNLAEVKTTLNYAAQLKLAAGVKTLGRLVVNSTLGVGGLLDVATRLNLRSAPTGFGTTLARWGMHPGPYLVIPILGPSTLRDGIGLLGDYATLYAVNVADLYRGGQSYALGGVDAVDLRSRVDFRYYSTGTPFEYETIRFLYVRKRLIEDEGLHKHRAQARRFDAPAGQ